MKVSVENILGITSLEADIPAGKILWVVGDNAQGKTSYLNVCRALFASEPDPAGVGSKSLKKCYVHDTADDGIARLTTEYGERWFKPGKNPIGETGQVDVANKAAVGMVDLFAPSTYDTRAAMWNNILHGGKDIDSAFLSDKIAESIFQCSYLDITDERQKRQVDSTVNVILTEGWDQAQKQYQAMALKAKREWAEAVGSVDPEAGVYGSLKAQNWRPPACNIDELNLSIKEAQDRHTAAQERYQDALASQAATDTIDETLEDLETELTGIQNSLEVCERDIAATTQELEALAPAITRKSDEINNLRSEKSKVEAQIRSEKTLSSGDSKMPCPCGSVLVLKDKVLYSEDKFAEIQRDATDHIGALTDRISKIEDRLTDIIREHNDLMEQHSGIDSKKRDLERQKANHTTRQQTIEDTIEKVHAQESKANDDTDILPDEAHDRLQDATAVLANVRAWHKACEAHEAVSYCEAIKGKLKASGIRAEFIRPGIDKVQNIVNAICNECKWQQVSISTEDYAISYGERAIKLCSQSEQWRIHACLQVAIAHVTKSQVCILDGAEILTERHLEHFAETIGKEVLPRSKMTLIAGYSYAGFNDLELENDPLENILAWPGISETLKIEGGQRDGRE